jgi:hypothetical protein
MRKVAAALAAIVGGAHAAVPSVPSSTHQQQPRRFGLEVAPAEETDFNYYANH